ncbi:hypothetical protein HK096_009519, partial [Nowakowskiella sp. JEL0078]
MKTKILFHFISLLVAVSVRAQEGSPSTAGSVVAGYSCSSASCVMPKCRCADTAIPGGLSAKDIPQIVTLTFDDSVNEPLLPVFGNLSKIYSNPNGCPLAATFFVSVQYTDYWLVQQLYGQGHEIATHTINHPVNPSAAEISGAYQAISTFATIPKNAIKGFRTPFLAYTSDTFQGILSAGLTYDSSQTLDPKLGLWPYTLDNGFAITCETGTCANGSKYAGLWSIPMYTQLNTDGSLNGPMDANTPPGSATNIPTKDQIVALWKYNFLQHYNGTRTPY